MLALEPAGYGAISIAAVIIAAVTSLYQVMNNKRHDDRGDQVAATTVVVEGLRGLMEELRIKNVDLEHDIVILRTKVETYRAEAQEANVHAAQCERRLASALQRISELERAS